jgi:tellurite methyltransferase
MERDEKTRWNRKYVEGSHTSAEPDPFLLSAYSEFLAETTPGHALDVAGGVGRHALWLAERRWKVKLVDVSEVGIDLAREKFYPPTNFDVKRGAQKPVLKVAAEEPALRLAEGTSAAFAGHLETQIVDLSQVHDLGHEQYDLILVFFYLERPLFPALISALRPGGFLIYKTYTTASKRLGRGPSHPMYLLQPNELLRAFQSLRVLHYHETVKEKGIAELVAQKQQY